MPEGGSADRCDAARPGGVGEPSPGRRRFLRVAAGVLGAGYAAAAGYPVYRYLASPVEKAALAGAVNEVSLPDAARLERGSALIFRFGMRPALLIHHRDGTWTSFSAVCTHLGCTVRYEGDAGRIYCICHGGVYDPRSGATLAGPPPRGLDPFRVEVRDGGIIVRRS